MTSGTYIKIPAGHSETDLQHGLQVCQKVEVMKILLKNNKDLKVRLIDFIANGKDSWIKETHITT